MKLITKLSLTALGLFSSSAYCADYSSIISALDFDSATSAVITVAGAIGGVYIAIKGARLVLGMLR